jgi:ABC-type transporter lipoprotein component MlaA
MINNLKFLLMKKHALKLTILAVMALFSISAYSTARVQVIHNSPDRKAEIVDVWLNNALLVDNFQYRTATPFIDAPSGVEFTISVAGPKSTSLTEAIWSQNFTLEANKTYVIVASGFIDVPTADLDRLFSLYVYDMGREAASVTGNTDVLVFHGALNAPGVSVNEIGKGAGNIINDFFYGDFAGYLELPNEDYILEVEIPDGEAESISFNAPLATLGLADAALVAVASGIIGANDSSDEFGIWVALPSGGNMIPLPVFTPGSARVQVIHNSADLAAQAVDVWLNGDLLLDNFQFRTATPFVDVPTGINLNIAIQGPNSTSADNPLWENNYVLEDGETYVLVANGIISPAGYNPSIPFDIYVYAMGRENSTTKTTTDVLVFHGSTDAPIVDVVEIGAGAGTIIDDMSYGNFAGYLQLPTADYVLDIRDQTGMTSVVTYDAPLATLGLNGAALVTVASGFLDPMDNSNGSDFGLWVALPAGGNMIPLPLTNSENGPEQTARVQVIHNSADLAAAVVDVWLNDTKLIEDFAFRTATPFIDAPAGVLLNIGIAPPNSTSWTQSFSIKQVVLTANQTFVVVANGITSASGYTPSPAFNLNVYPIGREAASQSGNTDVLVVHGSTDAPAVDVYETGVGAGEIVNDLMYGNVAGYLELSTLDYVIEVRDQTGTVTVAAYAAPLATLGLEGAALVTVASGFLDPTANSNGEAFGLWVALPAGGALVELPVYSPTTARVQVIHNSADLAAAVVDVWLDNTLLLDDFAFRTASPFIDAPAGQEFTIAIQGPNSTGPENPIWSQNYTLAVGETYVLVANGIVSPTGYDPVKPFDIYVYAMGREGASNPANTDVLVFHGSTDAPTVDVVEIGAGAGTIIDDFMYGNFAGYLELPTADYILDVRDESGTVSVVSYSAPLATLGLNGAALVTVASGFLDPTANSNGEAFGLWVALPAGGALVELPVYTPTTARVQVIHNSADMAAAIVDVWLDNTLLLDDFAFRTASPFIDAPAGQEFTIAIQGPNSTGPENPIWSQNYTLAVGETYVLVANGIVSPTGYDPVKPFDIYVYAMGREVASNPANTDVLVFHGSTDAPIVDVVEVLAGAGTIIDDLGYGEYSGYLELPTADYRLEIKDETGSVTVVAYDAPLASLGLTGGAFTVVASGFLNPENNSSGSGFGLWVALPTGGSLLPLPLWLSVNEIILEESVKAYPILHQII